MSRKRTARDHLAAEGVRAAPLRQKLAVFDFAERSAAALA